MRPAGPRWTCDGHESLRARGHGARPDRDGPGGGRPARAPAPATGRAAAPRPPRRRPDRARPAAPRRRRAADPRGVGRAVSTVLRLARPADNPQIAAIWNPEALASAVTTETEPRSPAAQRAWLARRTADHPVVVAVEGGEVLAFGALSPYRTKPSYRH